MKPSFVRFDCSKFELSQASGIYVQLLAIISGIIGYYSVKEGLQDFEDLRKYFQEYNSLFTNATISDIRVIDSNSNCNSGYEQVISQNKIPQMTPGCYCYVNGKTKQLM